MRRLLERAEQLNQFLAVDVQIGIAQHPRPRSLGDPDFDTRRQKLVKLFRSLEQPAPAAEIVA